MGKGGGRNDNIDERPQRVQKLLAAKYEGADKALSRTLSSIPMESLMTVSEIKDDRNIVTANELPPPSNGRGIAFELTRGDLQSGK